MVATRFRKKENINYKDDKFTYWVTKYGNTSNNTLYIARGTRSKGNYPDRTWNFKKITYLDYVDVLLNKIKELEKNQK